MISPDGWFDWAERYPGPTSKVNGGVNTVRLYIPHSAVGYWGGLASRLAQLGPGAASWHGSIMYSGELRQHYPLTAQCWASGSGFPNNNGVAFENEGGFQPANEPLTDGQLDTNVRILRDIAQWKNRPVSYWRRPTNVGDTVASLYEHRECIRFGSSSTACPSDRIPWLEILSRLNEVEDNEMWHPFSAWALFGYMQDGGRREVVNARSVFNLPGEARSIDLEIMIKTGYVVACHGNNGGESGVRPGWRQVANIPHDHDGPARVELSNAGEIILDTLDPDRPIEMHAAHVTGWYT